jgi:hypothetical protein
MADWSTIASLSTAGGTLVLAIATFSSVRASHRSARIAEQALLIGLRPVLAPARDDDPSMTVAFIDGQIVTVTRGMAGVERHDGHLYFVLPLRNVGAGLAVLHSWRIWPLAMRPPQPDPESYRRQTRDLYIPVGQLGFWQAALRDADDEMRTGIDEAYDTRSSLAIDLLYGDYEGGQRAVSRFHLAPTEDGGWLPGVSRHWRLDGVNPRD